MNNEILSSVDDEMQITHISSWRPARKFPETYPGKFPSSSYMLCNDRVHPVLPGDGPFGYTVRTVAGWESADDFLRHRDLSPLSHRIPVLAYGANRNPATLHIKLRDYGYEASRDICIPVLKGSLGGADIVACGLHGQGYLYGELLMDVEYTESTSLDVGVLLLDVEQLRVMNDSEGIRSGLYVLAAVPGTLVEGNGSEISPLAYVANERVWVSPVLNSPIAYCSVPAVARSLPGMNATKILGHVINALNLTHEIVAATAIDDLPSLAGELAKYLNGQWWYKFHTGNSPTKGYRRVMALFSERMADSTIPVRTVDRLRRDSICFASEHAYAPGPQFTWTRQSAG